MEWRFHIDELEVDEPRGFSELVMEINRDENWHGVFFEASVSDLTFDGEGATYLQEKKRLLGLKAHVVFKAESRCGVYDEFETQLEGKLNFGRYRETCGNECTVSMNVEQSNCTMTLRNRYDQKVDMATVFSFDNKTILANYDRLNFEITLPAKDLLASVEGYVADAGDTFEMLDFDNANVFFQLRPYYDNERFNSISTGRLKDLESNIQYNANEGGPLVTPQLLYEDNRSCITEDLNYEIRLKGHLHAYGMDLGDPNAVGEVRLNFIKYKPEPDYVNFDPYLDTVVEGLPNEIIDTLQLRSGAGANWTAEYETDYDVTWTGTFTPEIGFGYYALLGIETAGTQNVNIVNTFDKETYIKIYANKSCPPTTARVSMIHEALSRASEAITENCLKVKSDYYGRTDSQPYEADSDGCGGLRSVTSGLHIRKAENPKHFVSLKELYDGLKAIDNIGMGIEPNPNIPGYEWLRIESVDYFYQEKEILRLDGVPNAEIAVDESKHYSLIKVGYKKWEAERVQGLDEPNSTKEFRTSLVSVNNPLDITSNLITGSYVIETTRQQSFAGTGGADTKFDNDTFLLCMDTTGYEYVVEQGNISAAANLYSPQTILNWRVRPYYNLMRWFKSIVNSYPNYTDTDNKLFFSAGTGNILAEGELVQGLYDPTGCKLENGPKAENDNLSANDFTELVKAKPLTRPEIMKIQGYPLSMADYKKIKTIPYGFISVQCGTGEYEKYFIKQIQYKMAAGSADFQLIRKWQ